MKIKLNRKKLYPFKAVKYFVIKIDEDLTRNNTCMISQ